MASVLEQLKEMTVIVADTAVTEMPNAKDLADIAVEVAGVARRLGYEPKLALLAFSTFGHPPGERAAHVQEAVKILDQQSAKKALLRERFQFAQEDLVLLLNEQATRDRILADMRALIGDQLTPEQQPRYQKLLVDLAGRQTTRGRLYLLGADGKPRAYAVRLGISDGVMTELIVPPNSPDAAVLVEGATVITAVVTPAAAAPRSTPTMRPF